MWTSGELHSSVALINASIEVNDKRDRKLYLCARFGWNLACWIHTTIRIQIYIDHGTPQILGCIHNIIADGYETRSRNNSDELLFSRDSPSEMDYNGRFWTWCARIDQILHLLHAGSARPHTHQYGQVILGYVRMLSLPSPWFLLPPVER